MEFPQRFGQYILLKSLATGGMAEIFLAARVEGGDPGKTLVVKRLLPNHAENEELVRMFMDEARIASALTHPNIAQIYDVGQVGDEYFIAMEHVRGVDLRSLCSAGIEGKQLLPLNHAIRIIIEICDALEYAHTRTHADGSPFGVVHRDVSPTNILVGYDGRVKLVDFGIAKATHRNTVTRTGQIKGKFGYMAPEQARGEAVDLRADLYAVGINLYEITLLRRLFKFDTEVETLKAIEEGLVTPPRQVEPNYPEDLEKIILRILAPDPAERFQSARELKRALESFLVRAGLRSTSSMLAGYLRGLFRTQIATERRELTELAAGAAKFAQDHAPADALQQVIPTRSPFREAATSVNISPVEMEMRSLGGSLALRPSYPPGRVSAPPVAAPPEETPEEEGDGDLGTLPGDGLSLDEIGGGGYDAAGLQDDSATQIHDLRGLPEGGVSSPPRPGGIPSPWSTPPSPRSAPPAPRSAPPAPRSAPPAPRSAPPAPRSMPPAPISAARSVPPLAQAAPSQGAAQPLPPLGQRLSSAPPPQAPPTQEPSQVAQVEAMAAQAQAVEAQAAQAAAEAKAAAEAQIQQAQAAAEAQIQQAQAAAAEAKAAAEAQIQQAQAAAEAQIQQAQAAAAEAQAKAQAAAAQANPWGGLGGSAPAAKASPEPSGGAGPGGAPGFSAFGMSAFQPPSQGFTPRAPAPKPTWAPPPEGVVDDLDITIRKPRSYMGLVYLLLLGVGGYALYYFMARDAGREISTEGVGSLGPTTMSDFYKQDREAAPEAPARKTMLSIDSEPQGARVVVNGNLLGEATPTAVQGIEGEQAVVRVLLPGYLPAVRQLQYEGDAQPLKFTLEKGEAPTGSLQVESAPSGAEVILNGEPVGQTPLKLPKVIAGSELTLRLVKEGFHMHTVLCTVQAEKHLNLGVRMVAEGGEQRVGTVNVHSIPAGAEVSRLDLDRNAPPRVLGRTSSAPLQESATLGHSMHLRATMKDRVPVEAVIDLKQPFYTVYLNLPEPERFTGQLAISGAKGLTVYVGNQEIGTTPIKSHTLPEGTHTLTVMDPQTNKRTRVQVQIPRSELLEKTVTFDGSKVQLK